MHKKCKNCGEGFDSPYPQQRHCDRRCADQYKRKPDGYYSVYYLPLENYCGVTNRVKIRMHEHARDGRFTDGFKVLCCFKTRKEAMYHEALFQSTLAMEGLSELY